MASVNEMANSPLIYSTVRNHAQMEVIAETFYNAGITTHDKAFPAQDMAKPLAKKFGVTDKAIYKLLREKPGFASTFRPSDGKLCYYFEAAQVMPIAKQQGAKFYPRSLAALYPNERPSQLEPAFPLKTPMAGILPVGYPEYQGGDVKDLIELLSDLYNNGVDEEKIIETALINFAAMYVEKSSVDPDKSLE